MKTMIYAGLAAHALMAAAADAGSSPAERTTKEITVETVKLTVGQPYSQGHSLNANEASVLNQTYLENVRNNTAGKLKAIVTAWEKDEANKGKTFPGFTTAQIAEVQGYADGYEFGARVSRSSEPTDPTEREAFRIARDAVDEALKTNNVKKKDVGDRYDEMVKLYMAKPEIVAEAKRRVKARTAIGDDILAQLKGTATSGSSADEGDDADEGADAEEMAEA